MSNTLFKILVAVTLIFVVVFFAVPLLSIVVKSFFTSEGVSIKSYIDFFKDGTSRHAFYRSLKLGMAVMAISLILSYPSAIAINTINNQTIKSFLMTLIVLPIMTNPVARTFSWLAVIGRNGFINNFLVYLGFHRVRILYTETAVFIGLLQLFTPLMLLSLVSAFENLDKEVILAAQSLGAGKFMTFLKIQLPLTLDGAIMGSLLVFSGSVSAYVTPALLGGSKILMLSTLLYQKASVVLDWDAAITIAVIMILLIFGVNSLVKVILKEVSY